MNAICRCIVLGLAIGAQGCATAFGTVGGSERVTATQPIYVNQRPLSAQDQFESGTVDVHGSEVVVRIERIQACVVDQAEQKTLERVEVRQRNETVFIGEIVLASLSGALAAGSLLTTSSQCQGNTPDACDATKGLALSFGVLTGAFGLSVLADGLSDGNKTTTVRQETKLTGNSKTTQCGRVAAARVLVTLQLADHSPLTARTGADGLARFELPDLAGRTSNESQSATLAVEGGTPQHVSLSAR